MHWTIDTEHAQARAQDDTWDFLIDVEPEGLELSGFDGPEAGPLPYDILAQLMALSPEGRAAMERAHLNEVAAARINELEFDVRTLQGAVRLANERAADLGDQVEAAGRAGVRWAKDATGKWQALVTDDGLRDQLKLLADFHNKVCKLVNG